MLILTLMAAATLQTARPEQTPAVAPELRRALTCPAGKITPTPTAEPARQARLLKLGQLPDAHLVRTVLRDRCNSDDVKFNVSRRLEGKPR